MRLSKVKLAGFKSFVDPTPITFPTNLTGVVGPNGCGKSNVIDAVRWVMGELSAKHLRGDSMADVVFNGSSSRKPAGTASVELVFDNSDGKLAGAYAGFSEVSLKRVVSRDGSSAYYINGGRCRRKDITQLFLGTGLGSRSYAIIEQGMISRVIEARADDMRAFIEEAAGISLYKERRRETETRIADARENLARVQDLRDEVDKQIRHLQRQASAARKYQEFRARERQLTAECLALRLRDLDSGAVQQDGAERAADLSLQQALADLRSAEAALETQRSFQHELSDRLNGVQARYYDVGANVTRTEEQIRYHTELHARQQADLAQVGDALRALVVQTDADRDRLAGLRAELGALEPEVTQLTAREQEHQAAQLAAEAALAEWQRAWEQYSTDVGAAAQSRQVEVARIEQLEAQLQHYRMRDDRLSVERDDLQQQGDGGAVPQLRADEGSARAEVAASAESLRHAQAAVQELRAEQVRAEGALEQLRQRRERERADLLALEAVQKAALEGHDAGAARWVAALPGKPARVAERLRVSGGWERAVETVLGDYLEALCVDEFDALQGELASLASGSLSFIEASAGAATGGADSLAAHVAGPAAVIEQLARVRTVGSLAIALRERVRLQPQESLVTAQGEWVGRHWLRVRRGGDGRAGVIEREQRLLELRTACAATDAEQQQAAGRLDALRASLAAAERRRDDNQQQLHALQERHGRLRSQLDVMQTRLEAVESRHAGIAAELADVAAERARAQSGLETARLALAAALGQLQQLDERRPGLEEQRELCRDAAAQTRAAAQQAQLALRDALIRLESRRAADASLQTGLARLEQQREELCAREQALREALASGDAPVRELQLRLESLLAQRLEVEAELTTARQAVQDADAALRGIELRRVEAEQRVGAAREALEHARLQSQASRVRREALLEQFTATRHELPTVLAGLAVEATIEQWEQTLAGVTQDIDKLGQVNLAAIDELKEQSERKSYLDSQWQDVNSALQTLEEAMRKIETETRSRFDDTFNRINAGLQEKFPQLFGGGHAYLAIEGEDSLAGGVTVMARPPGKRNATISQLSGGEKALTAVALVFSIFDLNPAPFCLLDEVDAPLDEHNVSRFCDIVRDMSQRVQFIFITHNKVTMELASQLLGVTMNEPGVSRLVSVDIDEAVRLAAV